MKKIIYLLFIPYLLFSCCKVEPIRHNYHDVKDCLIDWSDIFLQKENDYLVYFYSERCGHCNDIKQEVLNFYFEGRIPMYFVCCDYEVVLGPKSDLQGVADIKDFYIFGTPFLIRIIDYKIDSFFAGSEEVKQYISILINYKI